MMKKIGLLFCLGLLFACERAYDENEFLGNSLNDQYGVLQLDAPLSSSTTAFDFTQNPQYYFTASWSKNANYELRIIGENSEAIKEFSGFGNSLDNNNNLWKGEANDFPSFSVEACTAVLSVSDQESIISDTLFFSIEQTKLPQGGLYIIEDFENISSSELSENSFVQFGANMDFDLKEDGAAQGQKYFSMRGEMTWNEWFLGDLKMDVEENSIPFIAPTNAFFNIGVLSSKIGVFAEDQFLEIVIRESDSDVFRIQIRPINWSSWRNISIPYSDFDSESEGAIRQTNKINQIEILCLSCPGTIGSEGGCANNQGVLVVTDIDFISFTENEPYQP